MEKDVRQFSVYFILLINILFNQCSDKQNTAPKAKKVSLQTSLVDYSSNHKQKLSEYNFYKGELADLIPNENLFPYALNTPLFTNYAFKKRFIFLPQGKKMTYNSEAVFDFEEGTIIAKNFYYPKDFRIPEGEKKIIETRLLIREKDVWTPLNYVWNDEQNEAFLNFIGQKTEVSWIDHNGTTQKINYHVPNNNQCKNCHINGKEITPIGPTAAQLNGKYKTLSEHITQLKFFAQHNRLEGLPPNHLIPQFAVWDDPNTGSLEERAKAYLDINCAHCHQPKGSAKNSGLDLRFTQIDLRKRGVFKPPVAAGNGSGNLEYSIVPGHPERSILLYRMDNTEPGIMMPEIGRSINHNEGVALISEYIKNLTLVGSD
jgi:uncharacterized repeat protein (TIGR03806 family)